MRRGEKNGLVRARGRPQGEGEEFRAEPLDLLAVAADAGEPFRHVHLEPQAALEGRRRERARKTAYDLAQIHLGELEGGARASRDRGVKDVRDEPLEAREPVRGGLQEVG